jgi:hypothetical protein
MGKQLDIFKSRSNWLKRKEKSSKRSFMNSCQKYGRKRQYHRNENVAIICQIIEQSHCYVKGKSVPLQAWSGPEGSRKLRPPDYMTTAQDGGKVVSLMHQPPLPPGNAPGTHFC